MVVVVNDSTVGILVFVVSPVRLSSPVDLPDSSPSVVPTSPPDTAVFVGFGPLFLRSACRAAFLSRSANNPVLIKECLLPRARQTPDTRAHRHKDVFFSIPIAITFLP